MLYYAQLKSHDVANGPGVRASLFVSGCTRRCVGCFNPQAWAFDYGQPLDETAQALVLHALEPDYIQGLTVLGGEPLEPRNQPELLPLLRRVREKFPHKSIWCYTGYDYETELLAGKVGDWDTLQAILACLDVLVDRPFVQALRNPSLQFRGSENQRLIDVPASLAAGQVVLWQDPNSCV